MELPNGTILMHVNQPYDPAKAHQYYLRTRQLKGRKPASRKNPLTGDTTSSPTFTVRRSDGTTVKLSAKQLAEQKAYAAKRVNAITKRLAELGSKLRKAMAKAQDTKAKSKRESSKPATASEKSQAARDAKKYRSKHQQSIATKSKATAKKTSTKGDPVAELETKITQIKDTLRTAMAHQRALAGATQNR
jgi:hypothetical protein